MRGSVMLLMWFGCGVEDSRQGQKPPPFELSVEGMIRPDSHLGAVILGAPPGERVYLGVSSAVMSGATCPAAVPCIDLVQPLLVGSAVVDSQGEARISAGLLPRTWSVRGPLHFQAATASEVSGVVEKFSAGRHPTARLTAGINAELNSGLTGEIWRRWGDAGRTLCELEARLTGSGSVGLPPCPDCAYTYDVNVTNYEEVGGDCTSFLGMDPSSLPNETLSLGLSSLGFPYFVEYRVGRGWEDMRSYTLAGNYGIYGVNSLGAFEYAFASDAWGGLP